MGKLNQKPIDIREYLNERSALRSHPTFYTHVGTKK